MIVNLVLAGMSSIAFAENSQWGSLSGKQNKQSPAAVSQDAGEYADKYTDNSEMAEGEAEGEDSGEIPHPKPVLPTPVPPVPPLEPPVDVPDDEDEMDGIAGGAVAEGQAVNHADGKTDNISGDKGESAGEEKSTANQEKSQAPATSDNNTGLIYLLLCLSTSAAALFTYAESIKEK